MKIEINIKDVITREQFDAIIAESLNTYDKPGYVFAQSEITPLVQKLNVALRAVRKDGKDDGMIEAINTIMEVYNGRI